MPVEKELQIKVAYHPAGKEDTFRIVEEVPGVEGYRYFVGMSVKANFVLGNNRVSLSEYYSPKFPTLEAAKAFLEEFGVTEYVIEPFDY